ncbi:MAG: SMP-30/gluconolactonase/LRE family protein [Candidatus Cybelea sp.]
MTRRTLVICAVATMLAACTSNSAQQSSILAPTAPNAAKHGMVPVPAVGPARIRPDHHKSWVSPDAKRAPRLLFVPDYGASEVFIFALPSMALKGTLTGFDFPEGACTDANGDIWIANTGAQEMQLYSRTGTLLKTLSVPNEYPAACAINKTNGDLAVTDIESTSGPGNVEIFTNASGTGTAYSNASIYEYFFAGYDPSGDLFVDGENASRTSAYLGELASNGSTINLINLTGGTLHTAGMVQWYKVGNYLALGDQGCGGTTSSCIYWVSIAGSSGTITATTNLTNYEGGSVCDLVQGVIAADRERYVTGPDYEFCGYTPTTASRWPYEAGGGPTSYNNSAPFVEPIGAAVSTLVRK